ncbi:MAG: YraN family protein [Lysobacterales bacterium]
MTTRLIGEHWETVAESFLRDRGLRPLRRNFQSRLGEVDLIMQDGPVLVFVEVRFRRASSRGSGAETVDRRKQRRIEQAAALFLAGHPRLAARPCRFDVVSMGKHFGREQQDVTIEWIKNAFQAMTR